MTATIENYREEDRGFATPCFAWQGATDRSGYGQLRVAGKVCMAHRVAYAEQYGELPKGVRLKPLCGQRGCVRADHWSQSLPKDLGPFAEERGVVVWPTGTDDGQETSSTAAAPEPIPPLTPTPSSERLAAEEGDASTEPADERSAVVPDALEEQLARALATAIAPVLAADEQVRIILRDRVVHDIEAWAAVEGIEARQDIESAVADDLAAIVTASPGRDFVIDGIPELIGIAGGDIATSVAKALTRELA